MTKIILAQMDMANRSDLAARLMSGEPIRHETMASLLHRHWWLEDAKWFEKHKKRSFRLRAVRVGEFGLYCNSGTTSPTPTHVLMRRQGNHFFKVSLTLDYAWDSWSCTDKVLAALWDLCHPKNKQHLKHHINLSALTSAHAYVQ